MMTALQLVTVKLTQRYKQAHIDINKLHREKTQTVVNLHTVKSQ